MDHFQQLADFHDFFGGGWGRITDLPELQLREVVRDMAACWKAHSHDVCNEVGRTFNIWFFKYADDPETLITEILAERRKP